MFIIIWQKLWGTFQGVPKIYPSPTVQEMYILLKNQPLSSFAQLDYTQIIGVTMNGEGKLILLVKAQLFVTRQGTIICNEKGRLRR